MNMIIIISWFGGQALGAQEIGTDKSVEGTAMSKGRPH